MTPYGDGYVYQRGKRFWIGYPVFRDGRWEQKQERGGATEAEARKKLRARMDDVRMVRRGHARPEAPDLHKMTVGDLLENYIADVTSRGIRSVRSTTSHIKQVQKIVGDLKILSVGPRLRDVFVARRRKDGIADATIDHGLEYISAAFRLAKVQGILGWDFPIRPVSKPKANVRHRFIQPDELVRLIASCDVPDLADFLDWFGWTSMRPGETSSLRWQEYDEKAQTITVRADFAKLGESRTLPVFGPLLVILERRRLVAKGPFIFHTNGARFTRGTDQGGFQRPMAAAFRRAVAKANLDPELRPYDIRRTAITVMDRAGVPIAVRMAYAGHRYETTHMDYRQVSLDEMREGLGRIESFRTETLTKLLHFGGRKA
jgi:integrase